MSNSDQRDPLPENFSEEQKREYQELRKGYSIVASDIIYFEPPASPTQFQADQSQYIIKELISQYNSRFIIVNPPQKSWDAPKIRILVRKNILQLSTILEKLVFVLNTPRQKVQSKFVTQTISGDFEILIASTLEEAIEKLQEIDIDTEDSSDNITNNP